MSDVSVRLGADFNDAGIRGMIEGLREGRAEVTALATRFKELGASESEAAASMKLLKVDAGEARIGLNAVYEGSAQTAQGMENMHREARFLRAGLAALVADMAIAAVVSGDTFPQGLKQAAQGMQQVVNLAIAGYTAFGPWGAAIGAGAGALIGLAAAAGAVDPELEALNKQLDGLAEKDKTAETLAKIMGWTEKDAEAALIAAKNNSDFADALDKVAKDREPPTWLRKFLDFDQALKPQGFMMGPDWDRLGGILSGEAYKPSKEDEENLALQQRILAFQEAGKESNKYYEDVGKASQAYTDELAREREQIVQYAEQEGQAFLRAAQARLTAERNNAVAIERLNRDLANTLERIEQDRTDKLNTIAREYADREADIAYNAQKQKEQYAQEDEQRQKQLSDRLLSIRLDEARSLRELDFNTHDALQNAKTNREREEILRRYQFEHGQITSRANEQRTSAEKQFEDERKLSAERRALALADFQRQRELNLRETQQKIADANRVAQEQTDAAKQRNEQQTADLKAALTIQLGDIQDRYDYEVARIEDTKTKFIAAERAKQAALLNTLAGIGQGGMGPGFDASTVPGFDTGGIVPGPRGAPRMIMAHGGEEVVRAGQRDRPAVSASPQIVNINANGSLAPVVRDVVEQMMRGHVFKEQVKIIFHDEVAR